MIAQSRSSILYASLSLLLLVAYPAYCDVEIYSNDFQGAGPVGPEWSTTDTDTSPGTASHPADTFLGQFSNQNVILTLNNLHPAHTQVTIDFDLYVIRSWDGNFSEDNRGPDFWGIDQGTPPVDPEDWDYITTFSNWDPATGPHQAYPGIAGVGDNPARTDAIENNSLGFLFDDGNGPVIQDAVYHGHLVYSHTASTFIVTFGAENLQALSDESWGIDNVAVTVDIPEPATLLLLTFGALAIRYKRTT